MEIKVTEDVFLEGKLLENRPIKDALVFDGENQYFTNELGVTEISDNFEQIKVVAVGFKDIDFKRNEVPNPIKLEKISGELGVLEIIEPKYKKPSYGWLILILIALYFYSKR
jgi:hypothetical protein